MATETEYKFLVTRWTGPPDAPSEPIRQGYLADGPPATTVRVRLRGERAFLTVKADSGAKGAAGRARSRLEFEYEIPADDGEALLTVCPHKVEKRRYVTAEGLEVDVFEGKLAGLVMAEMEVEGDADPPPPPEVWTWRDVSQERGFTNRQLAEFGWPEGHDQRAKVQRPTCS